MDASENHAAHGPPTSEHPCRSRAGGLGGDMTIKGGIGVGSAETARQISIA